MSSTKMQQLMLQMMEMQKNMMDLMQEVIQEAQAAVPAPVPVPTAPVPAAATPASPTPAPAISAASPAATSAAPRKRREPIILEIQHTLGYRGSSRIPAKYAKYAHMEGEHLRAYIRSHMGKRMDEIKWATPEEILDEYPHWSALQPKYKELFAECGWTEEDHHRFCSTLYWADHEDCYRVIW